MGTATATLTEAARTRRWHAFDLQLLVYLVLLVGVGLAINYSVNFGHSGAGAPSQTVRLGLWAAIGLIGFFVAASVDYHWLGTFAGVIYLAVLGLLGVNLAAGSLVNGAQLSVSLGGIDFQFSELGKVLMIVVLASYLGSRRERIGRLSTIAGAAGLMSLPIGLVLLQPDLGTALVFVAILVGMLFLAGAGMGWMALGAGAAVAAAPVVIGSLQAYQRERLFCFLDPNADPLGACYQLVQSLNAVGSGGITGRGLTTGQNGALGLLPVQSTDFVFAVVAHELGLVGGLLLLGLFALLTWRVLAVAWSAADGLGSLIGAGMGALLLVQAGVNIGMVMGLVPITGIPLPFVTYGGSSLISLLFGMGILESVRMHSRSAAP